MARAPRRLHLPDVQPDTGANGISECGIAAAFDEAFKVRAPLSRRNRAFGGRPRRSHAPFPAPTLRRSGAARHYCSRHRFRPHLSVVRRTYRRPRPQERRRNHGAHRGTRRQVSQNRSHGDARSRRSGPRQHYLASREGSARRRQKASAVRSRGRCGMKFSRIIWANITRKKVRLMLTIGSFAVALVLFAFLAVVRDAFNRGADVAGADRLVVINRTSIINLIPLSYRDKILRIPGVTYVTHNNWFGGIYQEEKNFFPQFVIDPQSQREVFPELIVPDDQWAAFLKDRQGAIAGARTAERFHWKIGDRIPIKTTLYGGGSWEFNLVGIYHGKRPQDDETQFWFQWDYFEEKIPDAVKGQIGWYVLRVNNPDDSVRIAKAIDAEFANSPNETKTESESTWVANWVKQFGNIQFLIVSIGTVVFFTLLLVTGNTMAISVRERTSELAVFKAIGYSDRTILFFVLAESLVIALFGGLLGLLLAVAATPVLAAALASMLPNLALPASVLALGLVVALLVGVISGLLPGIGAMRMRVVNALR